MLGDTHISYIIFFIYLRDNVYILYYLLLSMSFSTGSMRKQLRRPVALSVDALDGLSVLKVRMGRRKEWRGKNVSWNDAVLEALKLAGVLP